MVLIKSYPIGVVRTSVAIRFFFSGSCYTTYECDAAQQSLKIKE